MNTGRKASSRQKRDRRFAQTVRVGNNERERVREGERVRVCE